jgi:S-adenosylmethionine synthetase
MSIPTTGRVGQGGAPRCAEDVLAGHPDRVCDAIAEHLVTTAVRFEDHALVGVEVALHRGTVFVSGRMAASILGGTTRYPRESLTDAIVDVEDAVARAFTQAGYTGRWDHPVRTVTDLDVGRLGWPERDIRRYSDDQTVTVGHADPDGPDLLPLEAWAARRLRTALAAARTEHPEELGPDGKVLVELEGVPVGAGVGGAGARRPRVVGVNVAIQHTDAVGFAELHRWLVPHLEDALDDLAAWADPAGVLDGERLRVNGIGDFTCGGPMGDNGLSGKKLVVDHYGPRVPIGGGAICGKDPHKPDRAGALRARQVAVRLARATGRAATVTLGFLPGLEAPDRLWAQLSDGTVLDAEAIANRILVPDLRLAATARDLELAAVDWAPVMRGGYFGTGQAWES